VTHKLYSILFLAGNVLLYTVLQFALNLTTVYAEMGSLLLNNLGAPSQQYPPDDYENDNRHGYKSARVIVVDDSEPQHHNFDKAGDVDWVKFYVLANTFYGIEVLDTGSKCNPIIELYDSDGTTLLRKESNCPIVGQTFLGLYKFLKEGFYYVKLSNCDSDVYGTGTEYNLRLWGWIPSVLSPSPPPCILTGIISDSITKAPIRNARVKTDHMGSSLSNEKGSYTLIEEQGNWTLTVNACGYYPFSQNVSIGFGMKTFNVEMIPIGSVNEADEGLSRKGNAFNGITYSTNVFVAAGDYGALVTSPDGKTWTDRSFSTGNELYGIAFGNNTFVSVGDYGTILYSTDSIQWTKATSNTRNHLYGINYGDGLFIAVGETGTILGSPDGNTWTDWSLTTNNALYGVTYGNGIFVTVGDKGTILKSQHGDIWTDWSFNKNYALYGITYGNGIFVAVGEHGTILASSDGKEWKDRSFNLCYELNAIIYGDGTFIASGDGGKLLSSQDAVTWREGNSNTKMGLHGIAYGNGVFVAVGDDRAIVVLPEPSIVLQSPLDGTSFGACSLSGPPTFSWWTLGESFKGFEIQFSLDQGFSVIPVRIKATATQAVVASGTWKKVLMMPGGSEAEVYWSVMGRKADGSTVFSGVQWLMIEGAGAVENPMLSPTSKSSLPTLSWENNCGVKFKVWFGSDSSFTKRVSYSFNDKNPNDNGGIFCKGLTSAQWKAIRKLVNDLTGSTIYWYVESWDGLNRYSKTVNMNFILAN